MNALRRFLKRLLLMLCSPHEDVHLTRYQMYTRLGTVVGELPLRPPAELQVLTISSSEELARRVGLAEATFTSADYPEVSLLHLPYADGSFDVVISDQVLEHVEGDPQRAMDESFRVLRDGGIAIHTTCFMNPVHNEPGDLWRFTPQSLRWLCRDHDVIVAEGWGSRVAVWMLSVGLRYTPVPRNPRHPLRRVATAAHPDWPIVTWVVALKDGGA